MQLEGVGASPPQEPRDPENGPQGQPPQADAGAGPDVAPAANQADSERVRELGFYGEYRRAQIGGVFASNDGERSDDLPTGSLISGATRGELAARTEITEQRLRNSGQLRVDGTATFRSQVAADLNRIAPGTTVDANGVVQRATTRVPGHEQGYRLIDQLINNPNQVTIRYRAGDAYAVSNDWYTAGPQGTRAGGTVNRPNTGAGMEVHYDPRINISLPTTLPNGTVANRPVASEIVLAHELSHASHGQRGTIDTRVGRPPGQPASPLSTADDHFFTNNGQTLRELQHDRVFMREEFRTVGFGGYRQRLEPSENSIRSELGYDRRAAYIGDQQYHVAGQTSPGHVPSSRLEAAAGNTRLALQNTADTVVSGVRNSGRSAAIGGGIAFVTSAYEQYTQGRPLDEAAGEVLSQTALGAGTGVAQEVIERAVTGAPSVTSGATNSAFRVAANQARGAGVAGAVINGAFATYDQIGAYQRGEVTASQAIGTVAGEAAVGAASGLAGAYAGAAAGAAIGSIIPGAGTIVGGVVGFAVGAAAGYLADQGLRGLGVDRAIASGVTAAIDFGGTVVNEVSNAASNLVEGARNVAGSVASGLANAAGGAVNSLRSVFGW